MKKLMFAAVILLYLGGEVLAQHTRPEPPPIGTSISITSEGIVIAISHDPVYDPIPDGYVYKPEPVIVPVKTVNANGVEVIVMYKYWKLSRHEKWSIGGNLKDYGSYIYAIIATFAIFFKNIGSLFGFIKKMAS